MRLSLFGVLGFIFTGLLGHSQNGYDYRLTHLEKTLLDFENYSNDLQFREGSCFLSPEQSHLEFGAECLNDNGSFIWGDSHAAALSSGWIESDPELSQLTASACAPLLGLEHLSRPHCQRINTHVLESIRERPAQNIYLHANWSSYDPHELQHLSETIIELKKIGVKSISVIGGVPHYRPSLPRRLVGDGADLSRQQRTIAHISEVKKGDRELQRIATSHRVPFINLVGALCDEQLCDSVIQHQQSFIPIAWDYAHLTNEGAAYVYRRVVAPLVDLIEETESF